MSKSSQFLSLLLVCEGFPLSNSRLLSYRSGKACTQILQLGQSTSSLSHCFPEPCEPSDPAFQTVYSWCPSSSAFIFLISLPFSIFPQIRKVPPYSEIWHKSLKFQRAITLSTKSVFFFLALLPWFQTWLPEGKHPTRLWEEHPPLSPVQEGVSKRVEFAERLVGVYNQGIPWDDALHLPMHDGGEAVRGGFGSHPAPGNVLFQ